MADAVKAIEQYVYDPNTLSWVPQEQAGTSGPGGGLTDAELRASAVPISITDGTSTATVRNLAANDALNVAIVDGAGDQITSFGGGTQYTEGDVDASITGTATMMEVAGNTLQPVQGTVADGLLVNLGANNDVVEASGAAIAASLSVLDDWDESDRAKVNPIVGQAGVAAGTGVDGVTVQRVSLATNVALPAGTNVIGHVINDANSGVDIGDVTVDNAAGAAAVNVQDGGNSLTVDTAQLPAVLVGGRLDDNIGAWGGVAPTAATALSDTFANPTAPPVGSMTMGWSSTGSVWRRTGTDFPGLNYTIGAGDGLKTCSATQGLVGASTMASIGAEVENPSASALSTAGPGLWVLPVGTLKDGSIGFSQEGGYVQVPGFIFDDVAGTALAEDDVAAARITAARAQVIRIEGVTRGIYASLDGTAILASSKTDLTPSAPTVASVGVASAEAVAAAATRKGLTLRNLSTSGQRISLGFGATAVLDSGVTLYPQDVFAMGEYDFDLGAVNAIASAASGSLAVQQYLT